MWTAVLALFAPYLATAKTYLAANVFAIGVRVVVPLAYLTVFAAEWYHSTFLGHAWTLATLATGAYLYAEFAGHVPSIVIPANPVAPPKA